MRSRIVVCALMAMLATAVLAQTKVTNATTVNSPLEGVWRADQGGLPSIELTLTGEPGSLSGAVLFYFHHRDSVDQPWTASPGIAEPLFNPKFDGTTLTFQVSHRRAHPPKSLNDAPVAFRVRLFGSDKAALVIENEPAQDEARLVLVRSDY